MRILLVLLVIAGVLVGLWLLGVLVEALAVIGVIAFVLLSDWSGAEPRYGRDPGDDCQS
jgi:hypothetical protein